MSMKREDLNPGLRIKLTGSWFSSEKTAMHCRTGISSTATYFRGAVGTLIEKRNSFTGDEAWWIRFDHNKDETGNSDGDFSAPHEFVDAYVDPYAVPKTEVKIMGRKTIAKLEAVIADLTNKLNARALPDAKLLEDLSFAKEQLRQAELNTKNAVASKVYLEEQVKSLNETIVRDRAQFQRDLENLRKNADAANKLANEKADEVHRLTNAKNLQLAVARSVLRAVVENPV